MPRCAAVVLLVYTFVAPALAGPTVSDGTFAPSDWSSTYSANYGNGGSFTAGQLLAGGNPGAYYQVAHSLANAPPGMDSGLGVLHARTSASYDPSVSGPVAEINLTIDFDRVQRSQRFRAAIVQNGALFVSVPSFTLDAFPSGWQFGTLLDLVEEDFVLRTPGLNWDLNTHPDFSTFGEPMYFGWETANSTGVGFGGYNTSAMYDNFCIRIVERCAGDLTTTGTGMGDPGFGRIDGTTDLADLLYFVNVWNADLGSPTPNPGSLADLTTTGAPMGDPDFGEPDGNVDLSDLLFYVNEWTTGLTACP